MRTGLLVRLQKKSLEQRNCLYEVCISKWSVWKPPKENVPIPENYFQTKCYSIVFEKHWNNTRAFCLNLILQTWNMVLHTRFTELHILFTIRCTVFLSSTVFLISGLVFFLIRRRSSESVLWRSFFRWIPRKTWVKAHVLTRVASV